MSIYLHVVLGGGRGLAGPLASVLSPRSMHSLLSLRTLLDDGPCGTS